MKILVITAFYPPHHHGGYEIRCKNVLDRLKNKGHEIIILTTRCPQSPCNIHSKEADVIRYLSQRRETENELLQIFHDCNDLKFVEKILLKFQPDVIYLWHIGNLSNTILPFISSKNIPLVYDEGGGGLVYLSRMQKRGIYFFKNEQDPFLKKLLKSTVYQFARVVSHNRIQPVWSWPKNLSIYYNCDSALEYSTMQGAPTKNAKVIHSGVDLSLFKFKERTHITLPLKIICPGRIKEQKGILDTVYLTHELAARNITAEVNIYGEIQSKDYYQKIVDEIDRLRLGNSIHFHEMVSQQELSQIYRSSDVLFFPSYQKYGFSRVPLEAMASGAIVITYGNEGSNEVIQNGINGIIVGEGEIFEAVNNLEKILKKPEQQCEILRNARLKIEADHDLEKYIQSIESFLKESINLS